MRSVVLRRGLAVLAIIALWVTGSLVFQLSGAQSDTGPHEPAPAERHPAGPAPVAPSPAPGTGDRELGVQLSAHHTDTADRALTVMGELRDAGATWVRVDVGWATLQPNGPGDFDRWYVELIDDVLAGARQRDLQVILAFWLTPPWASSTGSLHAPPTRAEDYASAIAGAARRWHDDVDAWEIWNEPNFDGFFHGADPDTYTRLLCAAYPAVKRYDKSPVLFGGLMYNDDKWLAEAYRAGAKDCFDVLATHPYVGPSDAAPDTPSVGAVWRLTHTPAMRSLMDEWGDDGKPIWITELGWSSGTDNMGNAWDRPVTPAQQAQYLTEAVQLIRKEYPYVGPIIWYRDVDGPTKSYQDGFGLMRANLSPKPAMAAFEAAVRGR